MKPVKKREKTGGRDNTGKFTSENPGRPVGSKNKKTQSERQAAEWAREFALDSGAYQAAWKKTCELAGRGVQWAVQMVMDRVAGKVRDKVEGEINLNMRFDYDTENGNGSD